MAISGITRSDGANYEFQINLDTAFAEATTIRWEIHPTAGAFPLALATPLTGTLDFSTSETSKMVRPLLTRNHPFPRDFEIQLYNDVDDTLAFTSSEQRIAGDASLPDNSRSISGGGDQNVIGLGLSDTINPASGGSGDDTFIITRFQYGTLEIDDVFTSLSGQNLIKFDYGVTITAYREVSFTLFDVVIDSVTLTLSTGAVVTIAVPAGSFGYQLGSGEVLTYADFKTAIGATGMDSLRADYAITSFTDAPELSDPRLEARVARSLSGAGNEDIITAASDYNLTVSGGSGDDVFVVTRFQYGMLEIDDVFTSLNGQNLIKFDYEVTITDYAEVSFTLFDVVVDSVTLTLSTGAVVTIVLPAGSFGYQLGSGEVLTYAAFKAAIGATGASGFAGDFTILVSPVEFTSTNTAMVVENNNAGAMILTVQATSTHANGDDSPITSYMFLDENDMPTTNHQGFTIDNNGRITVDSRLDYDADDAMRAFTLRVIATDTPDPNVQGDEAETATQTIIINVGDANDNLPVFAQSTYTANVDETHAVGSEVARVAARDADGTATNNQVTYSITAGNVALLDNAGTPIGEMLFSIDSNGVITLNAPLNFEDTTSYALTIGASDGLDANGDADTTADATATVNITIGDINDESPSVTPTTGTGTVRVVSAADNSSGTNIGYSITVSDDDATNRFDVSVVGDADDRFDFQETIPGSGVWALYLKAGEAVANSELDSAITLTYSVTDGGDDTTAATGMVTLMVVDTPVRITPPTEAALMADENNADWQLQLAAVSDAGGGDTSPIVKYEFVDGSSTSQTSGIFSINDAGLISITRAFDFETDAASYALTVRATDSRNPAETGDIPFTVTVQDANDAPVFTQATYMAEIAENLAVDAEVVTVRAADVDTAGTNGQVRYSITAGNVALLDDAGTPTGAMLFSIDDGGVITLNAPLDYDTDPTSYTLEITAKDGGDNPPADALTDTAMVAIILTDVDDEAPMVTRLSNQAIGKITEIDGTGTAATAISTDYTIRVVDVDTTGNGFTFDITGDSDLAKALAAKFDFIYDSANDQWKLHLRQGETLDRDVAGFGNGNNVELKYTVSDGEMNTSGEETITLFVYGKNDNAPTLMPSGTTVSMPEQNFSTHLPRTTGITFTVEDADHNSTAPIASDFVVYAGSTGTDTDDRFEVVDVGGTWTLRLKANEELDFEEENRDSDPTIILRVAVDDGTNTPVPSDAITITVENRNDVGVVIITRDTATKTLTATLTDPDGILTAADGAADPVYQWFDVATGASVGTNSNTFTYTDDSAHYRVRVEYSDAWFGPNAVNRAESSTAPISLSRNQAILLEHDMFGVPLSADLTSDGSTIPSNELTLAFVTADGSTATSYRGVTISSSGVMPQSVDRLNYEALTPDEQANGIDFIVRATHDGNSVDIAFNVRVSDRPESVTFGDDYTDYLKTINILDGKTYTTTDTLHNAAATAESGGAITYTLGGTDATLFDIGTNGAVTFKADTTLDDDMKSTYEFEVIATETGTSNSERQSVSIDVSSIVFTSADTFSNTKGFIEGEIDKRSVLKTTVIQLNTERTNNADVTYAITGGTDEDLFNVRTGQTQGIGKRTLLELDIRGDFVRKAQYEAEITATNTATMETAIQMFTLTVPGYPETPPVIKLTLPAGQEAINYVTPLDVDEDDTDIITFTIEDPDKNYAASAISVVAGDGMTDARFTVMWDEANQMGTLQAPNGVDFETLDIPFGGTATDPRWTETFIRVTDAPEGSIASGDDVRVVIRVTDVDETGLAPAQIPDRQAVAYDPYDLDDDPLVGMTPLPDADPNA